MFNFKEEFPVFKSKEEKLLDEKRNVARLLVQIEDVIGISRKASEDCLNGAYEAAKLGRDEYATDLVETSAEIDGFVEDLEFVSLKIKQTTITADAMNKLGALSTTLNSCKTLFRDLPDFKSMGKKMGDITSSMHSARDNFRDFRKSLSNNHNKDDAYYKIFGEEREVRDPRLEQRVKDKMKAIETKLAMDGTAAVSTAKTADTDKEAPASMSDLARMFGDETPDKK